MQNSTPQPTSTPSPAEIVEQATRVLDTWDNLGPLMAVLGVAALALAFALFLAWSNRNSNSSVITTLVNTALQKDKDIADLKEQRKQEHDQHIESMKVLAEQSTRTNDLFDAMNNRGTERDKQQQRLVETQDKIATRFESLLTEGSKPVQEIQAKVTEILILANKIDGRTADWNSILNVITPLLVELGALRQEAKKHSTQPIPAIADPAPKVETSPL